MDKLIQKIESLSLRKWAIISICLTVVALLSVIFLRNYTGFRWGIFLGQLSSLLLVASLAVYSLENLTTIKTVLIIDAASFLLGLYGVYDVFNVPFADFHYAPYWELTEYYYDKIQTYMLIQNLILAIAFGVGFSSLKNRYRILWMIFTGVFALTFLNYLFFITDVFTKGDVNTYNIFIGILQLAGLIILFIKGGKFQTPDAVAVSSAASLDSKMTMASRSETLFKLKELLDDEIITQEDFATEKEKVLNGDNSCQQKANDLIELKKLRDANILTQEEYMTQKAQILASNLTMTQSADSTGRNGETRNGNSKLWIYVVAGVVMVVILYFIFSSKSDESSSPYNGYNYEEAVPEVEVVETTEETETPYYDYYGY